MILYDSMIQGVFITTGYQGMIYLKASEFGLPQRRQRLFILAVHRDRASSELMSDADAVLDMALKTYLPLLRIDCPDVEPCLHCLQY